MPVPDSQAGDICVWFTSCFFFVAIVTGAIFLVLYISDPVAPAWFPVAGTVLVGLPWLFWILTFLYRCITTGLRDGSGATEGGGRPRGGQNANTAPRDSTDSATELRVVSPEGNGRRVRFGAVEVVEEPDEGGSPGQGADNNDEEHTPSNVNDEYYDISLDSANEIEIPLASSSPP
ncbi:hypothetical protein Scep_002506 [Stephania cephalantha]|uniref:Uncharacterized protein n=1 Tax=Stephania cephalantha TaxID=152367 RepID=A0AAP0LB52_9MAGN